MERAVQTPVFHTPRRVTVENFSRAESDRRLAAIVVNQRAFGDFAHHREATVVEKRIVRPNRDTLYSGGVFDMEAGPVRITLPDAGDRFMSMIVINEDHYVHKVVYGGGDYSFSREEIDTRYVLMGARIFLDLADPNDVKRVHALQDQIVVEQRRRGTFEAPNWDRESQKTIREALVALGRSISDSRGMFGAKGQVDPVRHLIGTAIRWGGNPEKDLAYITVKPDRNDGVTPHLLTVKAVPVDAFWSISVYNSRGCFQQNSYDAYAVNSITAQKESDGTVAIQFGGLDENAANYLPIIAGWHYLVRLYRPKPEVLNGTWAFPKAEPAQHEVALRYLQGA